MASKRKISSEPVVSAGAAPARGKGKVTRMHQTAATADAPETATAAAPVVEPLAALPAESPVTSPTFEQIAQLAYTYWEERGYQGGSQEQDWLRAESELRLAMTTSPATA